MAGTQGKSAEPRKGAAPKREFKTQRLELGMALAGADRDAFLAAIDRAPEPAAPLIEALRRHRRTLG